MSGWHANRFTENPRKTHRCCEVCGRSMWLPASVKTKTCSEPCDLQRRAAVAAEQRRVSALRTREPLTVSRLREVLHYDPASGIFRWSDRKGAKAPAGAMAGHRSKALGYIEITIDGTHHWAHRLAWMYVHGEWPRQNLDHLNRKKDDNRIANLRDVGQSLNALNSVSPRKRKHLLPLGVSKQGSKFAAKLTMGGKCKHLGTFPTPSAAQAAYLAAKVKAGVGAPIA